MEFELSVIKETMKRVSDKCLEGVDISSINENDVKVFDYINFEGINDTELLNEIMYWDMAKDITVESMEDLIARIVLSRPDLEEKCKEFINNKNNPDSINYGCEELEHILAPTYGCIIYQEQIIQILIELAGYSEKQSDLVRRDMAKKARKNYESYKNDFVSGNKVGNIPGCVAKRISKKVAEKLYDDMWKAASYCFNKSHATSYATLAYRIAWLKCYYKDEYMDALEQMKASVGVSCEKPRKVPTPLPKDDYPRIKGITNDDFESFVAFDFETTGTNSNQDAIIEVGAIKVIDGKIIESKEYIFQEFVKPYKKKISEKIKEITGIDNADVENARDMWEVIPDFMEFVGDLPLVGFNSNVFDCRFLERAGRYSHIIIKNDSFDVMTYANSFKKELNIKKHRCSLADLSVALSITNPQAHRALADAITTAKVFIELKRR